MRRCFLPQTFRETPRTRLLAAAFRIHVGHGQWCSIGRHCFASVDCPAPRRPDGRRGRSHLVAGLSCSPSRCSCSRSARASAGRAKISKHCSCHSIPGMRREVAESTQMFTRYHAVLAASSSNVVFLTQYNVQTTDRSFSIRGGWISIDAYALIKLQGSTGGKIHDYSCFAPSAQVS